ncbi:helix-turn-helix domain-containing protein [Amycolatopsis sp. H6(2020)]|nr:helix-turn-helix domain-containing protein [Amycolatopsis sp. H6(2020)]
MARVAEHQPDVVPRLTPHAGSDRRKAIAGLLIYQLHPAVLASRIPDGEISRSAAGAQADTDRSQRQEREAIAGHHVLQLQIVRTLGEVPLLVVDAPGATPVEVGFSVQVAVQAPARVSHVLVVREAGSRRRPGAQHETGRREDHRDAECAESSECLSSVRDHDFHPRAVGEWLPQFGPAGRPCRQHRAHSAQLTGLATLEGGRGEAGSHAHCVRQRHDHRTGSPGGLAECHRRLAAAHSDRKPLPGGVHRSPAHHPVSVAAHIRARRLDRARRDLADGRLGHLTIATIARRWGFSRPADFSRAFRRHTGTPPRDYRNNSLTRSETPAARPGSFSRDCPAH